MPCTKCDCPKFKRKKSKKEKCKMCGHSDADHTTTSSSSAIDKVLDKYNIPRLRPKASGDEARKETNSGFRTEGSKIDRRSGKVNNYVLSTRFKVTSLILSLPQGSTKKDAPKKEPMVRIGSVHLVPYGVDVRIYHISGSYSMLTLKFRIVVRSEMK